MRLLYLSVAEGLDEHQGGRKAEVEQKLRQRMDGRQRRGALLAVGPSLAVLERLRQRRRNAQEKYERGQDRHCDPI